MRSRTRLILAFSLLGACSSDSSGGDGSGSVQGMLHGMSFTVGDAISAAISSTSGGFSRHAAAVVMADTDDLCGDAAGNVQHPNEVAILLTMADVNGTTTTSPTAPGSYAIYQDGAPPAKAATLQVSASDATCEDVEADSASATSGTITLTAVSGNKFTGSFDVVVEGGDHLTGNFAPSECPALQTAITNTQKPTCK
jgi:hypothetical protein